METERRRPHRRERTNSQRSSQPQQPQHSSMPVESSPETLAPSSNKKATIARSMSRYKSTRPKPPCSVSTPSVPPFPPTALSARSLADSKERPSATFDPFPRISDTHEDDDDTLVPPMRKTSGLDSARDVPTSPGALKKPRMGSNYQESSHEKAAANTLDPAKPARTRKASLQPRYAGSSGFHEHRSRPAGASAEDGGRRVLTAGDDSRRSTLPVRPAMVQKKSFTQKIAGLVSQPQSAAEAKEQLKSIISNPIPIELENPPPLLQFDAPKSAVNAGERTVRVIYKEFQVPIKVIPSTTPQDVIRCVSDEVASPIDQTSSVMLESFKQLGLERPLRRYEHIRDVLNSWDSDSQNTLVIEPSSTGGNVDDLDVKHVPQNQPGDASFHLYHSQRPSQWDKRVVMVRSDGQMLVAKSEGGEFSNICHLSDFDIYIPTARQMAKKLRPPKRICFAVKSQQKSNMFVSTVNFVHFFSSNDKRMAKSLYTAVQEWRSWYLVKMMGKGTEQPTHRARVLHARPTTAAGQGRKIANLEQSSHTPVEAHRTHSAPSQPFLESNKRPAMQLAQYSAPNDVHPAYRDDLRKDRGDRQAPPPEILRKPSTRTSTENPFTGGGLLGHTYTQRKKAQQGHEPRNSDTPIQFPTSLPSPVKAESNANGLKRTSSQRQKPKPLVDLTPVYQEPPQHSRKGRGVTPGQIPVGGLIDIATSPEVAIPIPPKTEWRRPGTSSGVEGSPNRGLQYR
ncbi:MAG: hypothetical protein Q9186_003708 [Xanthomendoza sp. 1 TL-2023]